MEQPAYGIVRIMVSIRTATERAIAFAQEALGADRTTGIRLEEVESTAIDGEDAWFITLSMINPDPDGGTLALLGAGKREYKSFTVLKRDGEVKSMKIRELANV